MGPAAPRRSRRRTVITGAVLLAAIVVVCGSYAPVVRVEIRNASSTTVHDVELWDGATLLHSHAELEPGDGGTTWLVSWCDRGEPFVLSMRRGDQQSESAELDVYLMTLDSGRVDVTVTDDEVVVSDTLRNPL